MHSESFRGLQADVTLEVIPISSAFAAQRNGDPYKKYWKIRIKSEQK